MLPLSMKCEGSCFWYHTNTILSFPELEITALKLYHWAQNTFEAWLWMGIREKMQWVNCFRINSWTVYSVIRLTHECRMELFAIFAGNLLSVAKNWAKFNIFLPNSFSIIRIVVFGFLNAYILDNDLRFKC